MIKLNIMDYCQNCPCFEAKINTEEYGSRFTNIEKNTTISCKNAEKCGVLLYYLQEATGRYIRLRESNSE